MRFKKLVYFLLATFILASCTESRKPASTGSGSEIIVVCNKPQWDGSIGDSIRTALTRQMQGLLDSEPEFTLINISEKEFSTIWQAHRNILFVDIAPENKKSKVETLANVWSDPQRVIKIHAGSDIAFLNLFTQHSEGITELFNQSERARFSAQNAKDRNPEIEKLLANEFGINMLISKDFHKVKKADDFIWLVADSAANSIGLLVYTYPFKDTSQLNSAAILAIRDEFAKRYTFGPYSGACMATGREVTTPISLKILFKELYAVETRGLWKTEDGSSGGPFINYTIVDAPRQRIVVFDGYVYYPYQLKRNFIRQLESIIWGAEFEPSHK